MEESSRIPLSTILHVSFIEPPPFKCTFEQASRAIRDALGNPNSLYLRILKEEIDHALRIILRGRKLVEKEDIHEAMNTTLHPKREQIAEKAIASIEKKSLSRDGKY